jgi:small-conductance mechanosensitive channel
MEQIRDFITSLRPFLDYSIFRLGTSSFTLGTLLYLSITLFLLFYLSEKARLLLTNRILTRYKIVLGVRQAIGSIVKYSVVLVGLIVIIQSTGVDLSALGLIAGALGVGIGFGLQSVTSNFVSGIIILFERPVKVGDRIQIGEITGNILRISARATTIITNDNIAIIIPNSDFINKMVINWTLNDRNVRFNFPVKVSYKEDPQKVKKVLLEVIANNPGVLKLPKPDILFENFEDSALAFNLRIWTSQYVDNPGVLKSQIYYEIFNKFKEHNIRIPYPQRDLHLISGFSEHIQEDSFNEKNDQGNDFPIGGKN